MLRQRTDRGQEIENLHGGVGKACVCELFGGRLELPVYVHHTALLPGAGIGEHLHDGSEEIYWLLEGEGLMKVDGTEFPVAAGEAVLTKSGSSHSLRNISRGGLRLIVIGGKVAAGEGGDAS
jgi:mannose-6-phosphate isomerase-like protein (cupin superfamily)